MNSYQPDDNDQPNGNEETLTEQVTNQIENPNDDSNLIDINKVKFLLKEEEKNRKKSISISSIIFFPLLIVAFLFIYQKINSLNQIINFYQEISNSLNQEINTLNKEVNLMNQTIEHLSNRFISLSQTIDNLDLRVNSVNQTNDSLNSKVNSMIQTIGSISSKSIKNDEYLNNIIIASKSLTGPGILGMLKKKEKSPFDPLFVASQSSRYIYDIINPFNNEGVFGTSNDKNNKFFIEFSFEKPITVNGMKIFTANKRFPRSFDIEVDGILVSSIKDAIELYDENKDVVVYFDPVKASKVRFIQTGPNWDEDNYYLHIKRIELLSPEEQYSKGIFETLIRNSEHHDPQRCGVVISSSIFDLNSFHMLNSTNNVDTLNLKDQWFQVEITQGKVILDGFRLKRYGRHKMRNYKIICTDDDGKPMSEWTTLIEINEQKSGEHKDLDVYEFEKSSDPVKFIRIVQTGPTWSNRDYLSFYHFDLFGKYY